MWETWWESTKELTRRMKAMRRQIAQHDVKAWADSFMTELEDDSHSHTKSVRPATLS